MGERQFSEQQVADIIRRAAEAQTQQGRTVPSASGLVSAAEVRRIAGELGIDANAVEAAIQQTSNWMATDSGSLNSVDRTLERRVEGELADEDYAAVMEEFVPSSGPGSQSITMGSTLNYKAMAGLAECNVNVSKKSGWTNLRVKTSAYLALLPTMLPAFLVSVVSAGIIWESKSLQAGEKLLTHVLILAAAWSLAIWGFRVAIRYSNRKIAAIMDSTAAKIADLNSSGRSDVALEERLETASTESVQQIQR
jgi:hypothetical protein